MKHKNFPIFTIFVIFLFLLFPGFSFACPRDDDLSNCVDHGHEDINWYWRTECDEEIRPTRRKGIAWLHCHNRNYNCIIETRTCTYSCGTAEQPATCTDSYKVDRCVHWCTRVICEGEWVEYRAVAINCPKELGDAGCGPRIEKRRCRSVRTGDCYGEGTNEKCIRVCDGDWNAEKHGLNPKVTVITQLERCRIWQKAIRTNSDNCASNRWGLNDDLICVCAGRCLEAPQVIRFFDNPNYPATLFTRYWGKNTEIWNHTTKEKEVIGILKNDLERRGFTRAPTSGEIDIALRQKFGKEILDKYAMDNILYPLKIDWDDVMGWRYDTLKYDDTPGTDPWYYEIELIRTDKKYYLIEGGLWPYEWEDVNDITLFSTQGYGFGDWVDWFRDNLNYLWNFFKVNRIDRILNLKKLSISQFNPYNPKNKNNIHNACTLSPKNRYKFKVRAVCQSTPHNIKLAGDWKTTPFTSDAPELKSPLDPDWAGPEYTDGRDLELELRFCPFIFRYKYKEDGNLIEQGPQEADYNFTLGCRKIVNGQPYGEYQLIKHPGAGFSHIDKAERIKHNNNYIKIDISGNRYHYLHHPLIFRNEKHKRFVKNPTRIKILEEEWQCSFWNWRAKMNLVMPYLKETKFSQSWRFAIDDSINKKPTLNTPAPAPAPYPPTLVGLPVRFSWTPVLGAASYKLIVIDANTGASEYFISRENKMFLDNAHWNFFTAERNFKWSVTPCRGFDGQLCYPNYRSDQGQFITSGTPPQNPRITSPRDKAGDKLIPITFEWDPVPKVKSYVIEIPNIGVVISGIEAKKIFDHPDLQLGETYQWRVKSCLHPNGEICGQWSPFQSFTIFTLGIPTLSYPPNNQEIYTYQMPITLSWDPVEHANFYEKIIYFQGEEIKRDILSATSSLFFDPGHRG